MRTRNEKHLWIYALDRTGTGNNAASKILKNSDMSIPTYVGNKAFSISTASPVSILKSGKEFSEPQYLVCQPPDQSNSGENTKKKLSFNKILEMIEINTS